MIHGTLTVCSEMPKRRVALFPTPQLACPKSHAELMLEQGGSVRTVDGKTGSRESKMSEPQPAAAATTVGTISSAAERGSTACTQAQCLSRQSPCRSSAGTTMAGRVEKRRVQFSDTGSSSCRPNSISTHIGESFQSKQLV